VNLIDRAIAAVSPSRALRRVAARVALAHYQAADLHRREPTVRASWGDADADADGSRTTLSWIARDVMRNNATAARLVSVIANNVVGTGIEPRLITADKGLAKEWRDSVLPLLDSPGFDDDGALTLGGMQALVAETVARDGEALVLWPAERGMKIRVLEMDWLARDLNGVSATGDGYVYDGVEYDANGHLVAYHLYDQHPGSAVMDPRRNRPQAHRVEARLVAHVYRADRPGQRRGVTWLAPVLNDLQSLAENDAAQLMRQRIAACFAVFWRTDNPQSLPPSTLAPGLIQQIGADDEVQFASPPEVQGYDDFARVHLRRIAVGVGITYEALTGDLTGVNFSSARIGRIDMGQNVERWQWQMMIPRMCNPVGRWVLAEWANKASSPATVRALGKARIEWTPPAPVIADPKLETEVATMRINAGLTSRHAEIRRLGYVPARIDAEITRDLDTLRNLAALRQPGAAPQVQQNGGPDA
jgi:lambda family phage portal protein